MPNDDDGFGQGGDTPEVEATVEQSSDATPSSDGGQGAYLGTFKTREDAEKGLSDLQRILNETRRRESEAKLKLERDNQLAAALKTIAEQKSNPGSGEPSKADLVKAARAEWAAKFNEKGNGEMVLELIDDLEAARASGASGEVAELKRQLAEVTSTLSEYDPTWQQAKTDVEEFCLKEKFPGLDRKQLVTIATEMRKLKPRSVSQPSRPELPGSTGGIAGVGTAARTISNEEFAEIEAETGVKLNAATRAAMQKQAGGRR